MSESNEKNKTDAKQSDGEMRTTANNANNTEAKQPAVAGQKITREAIDAYAVKNPGTDRAALVKLADLLEATPASVYANREGAVLYYEYME